MKRFHSHIAALILIITLSMTMGSCTTYRWHGTSNHKTSDTFTRKVKNKNNKSLGSFFTKRQNKHKTKWGKDSFLSRRSGQYTGSYDGFFKNKRKKTNFGSFSDFFKSKRNKTYTGSFSDFFKSKRSGYSTKSLGSPFSTRRSNPSKVNTTCNAFMIKVKNKSKFKTTDFFTRTVKKKGMSFGKDPFATKRKKSKSGFGTGSLFGSNRSKGWEVGKGYGTRWSIFDIFKRKKPKKNKNDPFSFKRKNFDTSRRESGLFPKGVMPND